MEGLGRGSRAFQSLDLGVDVLEPVLVLKSDAHVEGHEGLEIGEFFVMLIQLRFDLHEFFIHRATEISEVMLNGLEDSQNDVVWLRHGTDSPFHTRFNLG
jgi:hypothetical protein